MQVCWAPAATSIGSARSGDSLRGASGSAWLALAWSTLPLRVAAPAAQAVAGERAGVIAAGDDRGHRRGQRRGRAPSAGARCSCVPSPIWPLVVGAPAGQHAARRAARRRAARTRTARDLRAETPATRRGQARAGRAPPSPSWPTLSSPQQRTAWSASSAQEKSFPPRARGPPVAASDAGDLLGQAAIDAAAVAELAGVVGAPAEDGARRGGRAGVRARRSRPRVTSPIAGDADGERARRARAVAELAVIVAPPAPQAVVGRAAGRRARRPRSPRRSRCRCTTPARTRPRRRRRGGRSAGATARTSLSATLQRPFASQKPGGAADGALRVRRAAKVARAHARARASSARARRGGPRGAAGADQNAPPTLQAARADRRRSAARRLARCRRTSTKRVTPTAVSAVPSASVPTPTCQRDSAVDQRLAVRVVEQRVLGVVARGVRRRDEADADADADDAGAGEAQPERIAPPLGRRRGWRRRGAAARRRRPRGASAMCCAQRPSAICVAFACTAGRFGREEALVQRHRALAVAGEALRLALGEQELAPRIDRVARLEIGDGGRRSRARRSARARA